MSASAEIAARSSRPTAQAQRVLVVDDEALFANAVRRRLEKAGYQCAVAGTLGQAHALLEGGFADLILLDLRLPDGSGMQFLENLRRAPEAAPPVIVLTAHAEVNDAVHAMKQGAADYLKKPIDLDELLIAVDRALEARRLQHQLDSSRSRDSHAVEGALLLGDSPVLVEVRNQIVRLARLTDASAEPAPNVLVLGETGSGKDVAARLLHLSSNRRNRPFVHVDCASLPRELMEAELFGHEKGAFTNATSARVGLIEAAEDGTVFLDEIGELPLELQAKLLNVIERRKVRRIGSTREHVVGACFVAASNRNLQEMIAQGTFRADLYYRLNALTLEIPPLRARGEDVWLLALHFSDQTARRYRLGAARFTEDTRAAMLAYRWPGNVRELRHLVERAVMLSQGHQISPADLGLSRSVIAVPAGAQADPIDGLTLEEAERLLIQRALDATGGNVSESARRLGVSRMTLRYRMEKYGLPGE
ncbi:MAG TPA: sigma-54 dependent transcriptional regulator [Burkholderiales bacterium]|nr:sigma-54 dependent transcriptional regulator [Burkholderiales bacterium]